MQREPLIYVIYFALICVLIAFLDEYIFMTCDGKIKICYYCHSEFSYSGSTALVAMRPRTFSRSRFKENIYIAIVFDALGLRPRFRHAEHLKTSLCGLRLDLNAADSWTSRSRHGRDAISDTSRLAARKTSPPPEKSRLTPTLEKILKILGRPRLHRGWGGSPEGCVIVKFLAAPPETKNVCELALFGVTRALCKHTPSSRTRARVFRFIFKTRDPGRRFGLRERRRVWRARSPGPTT